MQFLITVFSALLFASGLIVSGMVRPDRVIGFLDIFGQWDPTLAFVMGGALLINTPLWHLTKKRSRPVCDVKFHLPTASRIDSRLILGAILFGMGWGLGGYCPGPAIVSTGTLQIPSLTVMAGMICGMLLIHLTNRQG